MKRSTAVKTLKGFLLVFAVVVLIFTIPADWICHYLLRRDLGGIEHKRIETNWILTKYELTGLPSEMREWLTRYHGEAPGQRVFYTFVDWGLSHPKGFITITEGVEPAYREKLIDRLATGIIDNLDEEEFAIVFGQSDATIIKEVREAIKVRKQHIERTNL